jgi:hypothetical protein
VDTRDSALVLRARSFWPTLRWPTWPLAPSLESPGLLRPSPGRRCTWTSELAGWCRRRTRDEGSDRLAERVLAAGPAGV